MENAKRDQNDVAVSLGVNSSNSNGTLMLRVDPVTDYLLVSGSTDSLVVTPATRCKIDQNDQKTKYGISSVDGITLVPIRTDASGRLLIQYT